MHLREPAQSLQVAGPVSRGIAINNRAKKEGVQRLCSIRTCVPSSSPPLSTDSFYKRSRQDDGHQELDSFLQGWLYPQKTPRTERCCFVAPHLVSERARPPLAKSLFARLTPSSTDSNCWSVSCARPPLAKSVCKADTILDGLHPLNCSLCKTSSCKISVCKADTILDGLYPLNCFLCKSSSCKSVCKTDTILDGLHPLNCFLCRTTHNFGERALDFTVSADFSCMRPQWVPVTDLHPRNCLYPWSPWSGKIVLKNNFWQILYLVFIDIVFWRPL